MSYRDRVLRQMSTARTTMNSKPQGPSVKTLTTTAAEIRSQRPNMVYSLRRLPASRVFGRAE
jgi:hypothetical protein